MMTNDKQKDGKLTGQYSDTCFDVKTFLKQVKIPNERFIPEWYEAQYLMNVLRQMRDLSLSEPQMDAVLLHLNIASSQIDAIIAEGYAARQEAFDALYGMDYDEPDWE